jgi:hypothetical protein
VNQFVRRGCFCGGIQVLECDRDGRAAESEAMAISALTTNVSLRDDRFGVAA